MDPDDFTLEEKCENLMNVVVESRKRFGKMCQEYEQKTSVVENKMLDLQLETISNYKFKPKNPVPDVDLKMMSNDADSFTSDILDRQKRMEDLLKNIKNLRNIVTQLNEDRIGRKLRAPLTRGTAIGTAKHN